MIISRRKYNAMLDVIAEQQAKLEKKENTIEYLNERVFSLMQTKSELESRLRFFGITIGLPEDPEADKLDFPKVTKI